MNGIRAAGGGRANKSARESALLALIEMETNAAYSSAAIRRRDVKRFASLSGGLSAEKSGPGESALMRELVYGTTKRKLTLDHVIFTYSKIKRDRISPAILSILRMAAYQIMFLNKIPVSAACDESVKLAKKYGNEGSARFVNAIARKIAASAPDYAGAGLSVLHSYPEWLCDRWVKRYGQSFAESLLEAGNGRPDFTVRANTIKISPDDLAARLRARGYKVINGRYSKNALILDNPGDFSRLPEFAEGLFSIQDESSMLCAEALRPRPGEKIYDACAAPGGKACYIAELAGGSADILAADVNPARIRMMEQNIARLGHISIRTEEMDAASLCEKLSGAMDKVLLDAPCSGLGVIRRKPEIKWERSLQDITEISKIQSAMLSNVSRLLKPGGSLIYGVCTTEPEECEGVVKEFLSSDTRYAAEDIEGLLPKALLDAPGAAGVSGLRPETGYYIYPNVHGIDGFYIAGLRRLA